MERLTIKFVQVQAARVSDKLRVHGEYGYYVVTLNDGSICLCRGSLRECNQFIRGLEAYTEYKSILEA